MTFSYLFALSLCFYDYRHESYRQLSNPCPCEPICFWKRQQKALLGITAFNSIISCILLFLIFSPAIVVIFTFVALTVVFSLCFKKKKGEKKDSFLSKFYWNVNDKFLRRTRKTNVDKQTDGNRDVDFFCDINLCYSVFGLLFSQDCFDMEKLTFLRSSFRAAVKTFSYWPLFIFAWFFIGDDVNIRVMPTMSPASFSVLLSALMVFRLLLLCLQLSVLWLNHIQTIQLQ